MYVTPALYLRGGWGVFASTPALYSGIDILIGFWKWFGLFLGHSAQTGEEVRN